MFKAKRSSAGRLAAVLLAVAPVAQGAQEHGGAELLAELGCAACHAGIPEETPIRDRAPDLSDAGARYRPEYLFAYLRGPQRVRRNVGASRMPDFRLDERESLALTLFLSEQVRAAALDYPSELLEESGTTLSDGEVQRLIEVQCLNCHSLEGAGGDLAVELTGFGHRLQEEWVRRMLAAPAASHPGALMPDLFYGIDPSGAFRELVPDPANRIRGVVGYLYARTEPAAELQRAAFARARASHPEVDAALGERIFRSQNCAGCHRHDTIEPWSEDVGPDLSLEPVRVQRAWLEEFLAAPRAIRPFGYHPGSGSRMPDFSLTEDEVTILAGALLETAAGASRRAPAFRPVELSAFSRGKARALLEERYACLGCHRLGDRGGRIGPDLSSVGARLAPAFLRAFLEDPQGWVPGTVMPRIPLAPNPAATADLVAAFLAGRDETGPEPDAYLSLADTPIRLPGESAGSGEGARLYATYCASCHGDGGAGDGYNAAYLPTPPVAFSDPEAIAARSDDTLFDGIHSGGAILDRSHLMPPWGHTLGAGQIGVLVEHLRTLCRCEGPEWSRR